jgi:hypothetical protein
MRSLLEELWPAGALWPVEVLWRMEVPWSMEVCWRGGCMGGWRVGEGILVCWEEVSFVWWMEVE